jgi:hypothetical protein
VLARVLFTHETPSGWQRQALTHPVTLAAGKQYVVAYSSPAGLYRYTYSYYSPGHVRASGPLQAGAGVFRYGAGVPQQTFRGSNYWVDLEFRYNPAAPSRRPAATPSPSSSPAPGPAGPSSDPAPTGQGTTPTPVQDCTPSTAMCGYPDSTSTGVPKGTPLRVVGTQTTGPGWHVDPRGWVAVDGTGAVLDGLDIPYPIEVSASNVTIKNTRVRGKGFWSIRVHDGLSGVVIQDCEVNGQGTSGTAGSNGIQGTATVQRCDISGVENGITPDSGSVLRDNFVHNLGAPGAAHYDGIQIDGGLSGITIEHNTILNQFEQTSAVMIDNYFGPTSNITVNDNYLGGGGYTVYSDGQFSGGSISGVRFTNNRMVKGTFGFSSVNNNVVVDTGNTDAATGSSLHLN